MEPTQLPASLLDGAAWRCQGAATAVEARRKIVVRRQALPAGQQIPNGADWQGQLLGDLQWAQASVVQVKDLLTLLGRGSRRHGTGLRGWRHRRRTFVARFG
jgi:hypothetical protein